MNCNTQINSQSGCFNQQQEIENLAYHFGGLNAKSPQCSLPPCFRQPLEWNPTEPARGALQNPQPTFDNSCDYQLCEDVSHDSYEYTRCDDESYAGQPNVFASNSNKVNPANNSNNGNLPNRHVGATKNLNLPCQASANWNYDQCYSYYANGCYNTCQFIDVGDIEDFM